MAKKVAEAKAEIAQLATVEAVNAYVADETRESVLHAARERIAELEASANAADMDVSESNDAAADATVGPIDPIAQEEDPEEDDKEEEELPAPPPGVVQGKGGRKPSAPEVPAPAASEYQVKNPNASGKIGFKGRLYSRAEVAASPKLLKLLFESGCNQVIKK
jgi:hypothetical protein